MDIEIQDSRAVSGNKEDLPEIEIHGTVEGFVPAFDRVLIKRLPKPPDGLIARPEILQEQASRGHVVAVGESKYPMPPVGSIASFSKFAEEKHFDNEDGEYALVWSVDIRGWHAGTNLIKEITKLLEAATEDLSKVPMESFAERQRNAGH